MTTPPEPLTVFISYAHEDEELCEQLIVRLRQLQREGIIKPWHDRQITSGREWAKEINENLEAADIVLLLISPDFLNSDYCYDKEMRRALERHTENKVRVIPIILRPADWQTAPFGKLQCLPSGAKPITTSKNKDEAFLDVIHGIRETAEELRGLTSSVPLPFVGSHSLFTGNAQLVSYSSL